MAIAALILEQSTRLITHYYIWIWGLLTLLSALLIFLNFLTSDAMLSWMLNGKFESLTNSWDSSKWHSNLKFDLIHSPIFYQFSIGIALATLGYIVFFVLNLMKEPFSSNIDKSSRNAFLIKLKNFLSIFFYFFGIIF